MPKVKFLIASVIAAAPLAPAGAVALGPHADECVDGKPSMLVHVEGLKARTGIVRVQTYGGDPSHYCDKGTDMERVEVRVPPTGEKGFRSPARARWSRQAAGSAPRARR